MKISFTFFKKGFNGEYLELAQFPVTARGGRGSAKQTSEPASANNLCLYQASSRGGGCNFARLGSPEPGLVVGYSSLMSTKGI